MILLAFIISWCLSLSEGLAVLSCYDGKSITRTPRTFLVNQQDFAFEMCNATDNRCCKIVTKGFVNKTCCTAKTFCETVLQESHDESIKCFECIDNFCNGAAWHPFYGRPVVLLTILVASRL